MKILALTINGNTINGPLGMPSGGFSTVMTIIGIGIALLILTAVILAILYLIWGGYDWMISEGNKQKIQSAQQKIVFAIIGLIAVFLAYAAVSLVFHLFFGGGAPPTGGGGPHPVPI